MIQVKKKRSVISSTQKKNRKIASVIDEEEDESPSQERGKKFLREEMSRAMTRQFRYDDEKKICYTQKELSPKSKGIRVVLTQVSFFFPFLLCLWKSIEIPTIILCVLVVVVLSAAVPSKFLPVNGD